MRRFIPLALACVAPALGAQSIFDIGARVAPQFHSYKIEAPSNITISEFAVPMFVSVPITSRFGFDVGTSYARARVEPTGGTRQRDQWSHGHAGSREPHARQRFRDSHRRREHSDRQARSRASAGKRGKPHRKRLPRLPDFADGNGLRRNGRHCSRAADRRLEPRIRPEHASDHRIRAVRARAARRTSAISRATSIADASVSSGPSAPAGSWSA